MCFSISRRNSTLNWYLLNVIRLLRTVRRGADERTVSIQKVAPAGRVLWGNIWQWCCIEVIALRANPPRGPKTAGGPRQTTSNCPARSRRKAIPIAAKLYQLLTQAGEGKPVLTLDQTRS